MTTVIKMQTKPSNAFVLSHTHTNTHSVEKFSFFFYLGKTDSPKMTMAMGRHNSQANQIQNNDICGVWPSVTRPFRGYSLYRQTDGRSIVWHSSILGKLHLPVLWRRHSKHQPFYTQQAELSRVWNTFILKSLDLCYYVR